MKKEEAIAANRLALKEERAAENAESNAYNWVVGVKGTLALNPGKPVIQGRPREAWEEELARAQDALSSAGARLTAAKHASAAARRAVQLSDEEV